MNNNIPLEEIEDIKKYARTVFYNNKWLFKSIMIEDLEQEFLLEYIETNDKKRLASNILYRYTARKEKIAVRDFLPFSAFEHETLSSGDLYNYLEESEKFFVYDNYNTENTDIFIKKIAELCYPEQKHLRERIFAYLYGEKVQGDHARTLRVKFFKKAKEILMYFLLYEKISEREFFKYCSFLETMTSYAPQVRKLNNSPENIANREYYERNKEEQRKRLLENYYKRKAIS